LNDQRILIIEDDPHFGRQLVDLLGFHGYGVVLAPDGPAGVEAFEAQDVDLVLADLMLPGMGGVDVIKCIRGLPRGAEVPVLLMSAVYKNPRMFEKELRQLGILEFLAKPFSLIDLGRKVDAILDQALDIAAEEARVTATGSWKLEEIQAALGDGRLGFPEVGTFDRRSLLNLIIDVFHNHSDGRLLLRRGKAERRIYFLNGYPVWVRSDDADERLGAVLQRMKLLSPAQVEAALRRSAIEGILFREAIIGEGFIGEFKLFRAERARVQQVVVQSFAWADGEYDWKEGDEFVDRVGVFEVNPVPCLCEATRRFLTVNDLAADIEERSGHVLERGPRFKQLVPYFELPMAHGDLSMFFGQEDTVIAQLFRQNPHAQEELVKALWLLFRLEIADSRAVPLMLEKPAPPERPKVPPPRPVFDVGFIPPDSGDVEFDFEYDGEEDDEPDEQPLDLASQTIVQDYVALSQADYYSFLGVDREVGGEGLSSAYQQRTLRWRTARLPSDAPSEVRQKAKELTDRLEVAFRTLSNASGRTAYDLRLAVLESGEWQRPSAAELLQEARQLVADEQWADAEPVLRELVDLHPHALEVLSLLGRVIQARAARDVKRLDEARMWLRRALGQDPLHLRTLRTMGEVCKGLGDLDGYRLTAATIRTIDPQDPWLILEAARQRR
jgi:CheY-like chemotaxis protein